jgi:hypothetical protein
MLRGLYFAAITVLGLVTIVGSGGGVSLGFPPFGAPSDGYTPSLNPAVVGIHPSAITVQSGGSVTYAVSASGAGTPTYQWQRSSDGGHSFVDIAGATAGTYTLTGVSTSDDGAVFKIKVQPSNGAPPINALSSLAVSSMPAVIFQDEDFQESDWVVTTVIEPALPAPTHSETRVTTGGNPDAFRKIQQDMSQGSRFHVFHSSATAIYTPATQGAIHVIDYAEDCEVLNATTLNYLIEASVLLEQGGRRYVTAPYACFTSAWSTSQRLASLTAANFRMFDGPACTVGESCPDFSATGLPLRLGFSRYVHNWVAPAGSITHGIDNWKVSIWRP